MFNKTKAILLKKTVLPGNSIILKMYTKEFGVKSYFTRINKKSKNTFLPLSLVNITAQDNPKKDIQSIKELEVDFLMRSIYQNIYKTNILLFLNEILAYVIQEQESNYEKFEFIENSILRLEKEKLNVDFHLIFLIQLTRFLGFEPQLNEDKIYFDMEEGELTNSIPSHSNFLDKAETTLIKSLYESAFETSTNPNFTNKSRKQLLRILVTYYKYHTSMRDLKSLPVLEMVFN